ncbi:uncharacterized protein LOC135378730 [Ornithodoros turicata]|uniref:uncharacterized protein LOC135378730 n=1 Tax=Ornithodoros turicata TaxID=34597 RepID=UPI003139F70E
MDELDFVIIKFPAEDNDVAVAHACWVDGNFCWWPPEKNPSKLRSLIIRGQVPQPNWKRVPCIVIGRFRTYEEARRKLLDAENTSDLQSDIDHCRVRKKRRRLISASDSESDAEPILPAPPDITAFRNQELHREQTSVVQAKCHSRPTTAPPSTVAHRTFSSGNLKRSAGSGEWHHEPPSVVQAECHSRPTTAPPSTVAHRTFSSGNLSQPAGSRELHQESTSVMQAECHSWSTTVPRSALAHRTFSSGNLAQSAGSTDCLGDPVQWSQTGSLSEGCHSGRSTPLYAPPVTGNPTGHVAYFPSSLMASEMTLRDMASPSPSHVMFPVDKEQVCEPVSRAQHRSVVQLRHGGSTQDVYHTNSATVHSPLQRNISQSSSASSTARSSPALTGAFENEVLRLLHAVRLILEDHSSQLNTLMSAVERRPHATDPEDPSTLQPHEELNIFLDFDLSLA